MVEINPMNKLPRQNIDLNQKAPVIRQLPNQCYKGIIQSTKHDKRKAVAGKNSTARPLNQNSHLNQNAALKSQSRRPFCLEDELD